LAKGSDTTVARRRLAENICAAYPQAEVIEDFGTPHNRVNLGRSDPLSLHEEGKRTLVLAEHNSAVRHSTEEGNSCPNYWHFSPYGFCPYGCAYCYLAGTQGVRFSPTVKVFLNLPEILAEVDRVARRIGEPTAFYLGKLQDGLALDPLTGYSRQIIPFFAAHPTARLTLLTKSADVGNLLDLDHQGHAILSWTVNPRAVIETFEKNTPPLEKRIAAMEAAARAGYPVRAVVMPIIPIPGWEAIYREFLTDLLSRVRLWRITLGSICSYPQTVRLMEQKLGPDNPISTQLDQRQSRMSDGRARFPQGLREEVYRHLLRTIRQQDADVEIGLCLEEPSMFDSLDMGDSVGRCNCAL
jgi:spore photoproduct lyase